MRVRVGVLFSLESGKITSFVGAMGSFLSREASGVFGIFLSTPCLLKPCDRTCPRQALLRAEAAIRCF